MKVVKTLLVIAAIIALTWILTVGALYAIFGLLMLILFYQGAVIFLIGAVLSGLVAWIVLKLISRRKVYKVAS